MPEVRLENHVLVRGQERVPLLMGEVHYWRLAPARWPVVLASVRRLGLEMVATYVPWQYHELSPGRFDFTGETEPQRNLVGFLGLLGREGFACFIRPGPYIYAEWTNAGVPDRVVGLPRISEAYRREARVWMGAVVGALKPFFATSHGGFERGGPIVLFQPDNEADLFSHWFERQCGLDGGAEGGADPAVHGRFFQAFLRTAYPDVAALNQAWGTSYATLDDAQPAAAVTDRFDRGALSRARDYWRFQHWATREIVRWHAEEYRCLGVDLPMVANYYPGGDVQNWRALADSGVDFLGIDWYARNEFRGPPSPPGAAGASGGGGIFGLPPHREHRVFLDSCRMQSAVSRMPFIAEFECGVWHGYESYTGSFTPNHYRLMACSALQAGIKGWNWYMFVGRDNWLFSPINERGEIRPELGEEFLAIHRVWRELDPPTLVRDWDVAAAAFVELDQIGTDDVLGSNAVLQALYDARVDYDLFDAAALPAVDPAAVPLLFYASAAWLDRDKQRVLTGYMERGGTLVLFTEFPRADERFAPHNGLGVRMPHRVLSRLGKKIEVQLPRTWMDSGEPGLRAVCEGEVWVWDQVPRGAEPIVGTQVAGKQQAIENADVWMRNYIGKRWTVGYCEPRGRGTLFVMGMPVNAALVGALVGPSQRPETPGVQAAVLSRRAEPGGDRRYIVMTNLNQHEVLADLASVARAAGEVRARDLFTGDERRFGDGRIALPLGRASGGVWEIRGGVERR
jgi:hypothetical protein